jgi:hypothetical protein
VAERAEVSGFAANPPAAASVGRPNSTDGRIDIRRLIRSAEFGL